MKQNDDKNTIRPLSDDEFKKAKYALSNEFIRMPKALSVNALQTFGIILSKIDWKNVEEKDNYITIKLPLQDIMKACNAENSNNIDFYIKTTEELQDKALVKIKDESGYKGTHMFPYIHVDPVSKIVEVDISNRLHEFIYGLSKNYTVFLVSNTSKFTSRFSYILYINLCSWNEHKIDRDDPLDERRRYYTTKQLKTMFDLSDEAYVRKSGKFDRKAFEDRVINKAVNEINLYTNLRVSWWKEYEGKKVSKYYFEWVRLDGFDFKLGVNNI